MKIQIREIDDTTRSQVVRFIKDNWGSGIMVVKGRVHNMEELPGFIAIENNHILGIITYNIESNQCEIVSLDSFKENNGIGSMLIERVIKNAQGEKCNRVWLITTNDNTKAMRFYQKRGFTMKDIYVNAVKESRKIKPEIPMFGNNGISILHEIEFEKELKYID